MSKVKSLGEAAYMVFIGFLVAFLCAILGGHDTMLSGSLHAMLVCIFVCVSCSCIYYKRIFALCLFWGITAAGIAKYYFYAF